MAQLPLNLKGFKKAASDKHTTTLEDKNGHQIKLVHSALSEDMRGKLKALPFSDEKTRKDLTEGQEPVSKRETPKDPVRTSPKTQKMSDGGEVNAMSKGASESESQYNENREQRMKQSQSAVKTSKDKYGNTIQSYSDGGEIANKKENYDDKIMVPMSHEQAQAHYAAEKKAKASPTPVQNYADGTPPGGVPAPSEEDSKPNGPQTAPVTINIGQPQQAAPQPAPQQPAPMPQTPPEVVPVAPMASPLPPNLINPNAGQQALSQSQAINPRPTADAGPQYDDTYGAGSKEEQAKMWAQSHPAEAMKMGALTSEGGAPSKLNDGSAIAPKGLDPNAASPASDPYGLDAQATALSSGINEQKVGMMQEANALGARGQAEANALGHSDNLEQQNLSHYQDQYKKLDEERTAFQDDYANSHIDPNRVYSAQGTGGKIATAIGLILGGMAGGVMGTSNPAMDFINKQIDRDIEAQKAEMGKKENLLSASMRQYGNIRDATDMARVHLNDVASMQLKQAAAKTTNSLAQAAALKGIGELDQRSYKDLGSVAMRKTLMAGMGGSDNRDPNIAVQKVQMLRMLGDHDQAKSLEERIVPGVGVSDVPLAKENRDKLEGHQKLGAALDDLESFVKNNTTIVPGTPAYNTGRMKAKALQTVIRESKLNTVYREGEQPLLDEFINGNPAGFKKAIQTIPQLQELRRSNDREFGILKHSLGVRGPGDNGGAPANSGGTTKQFNFKPSK